MRLKIKMKIKSSTSVTLKIVIFITILFSICFSISLADDDIKRKNVNLKRNKNLVKNSKNLQSNIFLENNSEYKYNISEFNITSLFKSNNSSESHKVIRSNKSNNKSIKKSKKLQNLKKVTNQLRISNNENQMIDDVLNEKINSSLAIGLKKKKLQQQKRQQNQNRRGQRQKMNKNALRLLAGEPDNAEIGGAFPPLFNIAPRAKITVNATCGQNGREEYCKLIDAYPHKSWATQCGICYSQSLDNEKNHPIETVLDNNNQMDNWWQSPTLRLGHQYEYVTITIDLKQIFQIFFIMLKAANSPRPTSWILEKSLDNITYEPWQYFGLSDLDCRRRYNTPGQTGKYVFSNDKEVICTTQFSKAMPLENGEIHVSLLKNRPGAIEQSPELLEFITTRFIRIRFQGMHSTANLDNSVDWLLDSESLEKRSFYSLKQIRISGRLNCHGHANKTEDMKLDDGTDHLQCLCEHNTCGEDCSHCCSYYHGKPFKDGTYRDKNACEKCECNGHSDLCTFKESVGGICQNCQNHTIGDHCEFCESGYFRKHESQLDVPCNKCQCNPLGAESECNPNGGECKCTEGFVGENCEFCAPGYYGEYCLQCACDKRGTLSGGECDEHCHCKNFVEGETCSQCILGYFGLRSDNQEGCQKCWCSGVGLSCKSAHIQQLSYETLEAWKVTDLSKTVFAYPSVDNVTGDLVFGMFDLPDVEAVYWLAPKGYLGNRLASYGAKFILQISWIVIRGDTSGKPTSGPDIILMGRNGMKIAYGDNDYDSATASINVKIREDGWYHVPRSVKDIVTKLRRSEYRGEDVTRFQFMSVIADLEAILIRGTFHTDQVESILERATFYAGEEIDGIVEVNSNQGFIEECICPPGYQGFSCETCEFGYIRIFENSSAHEMIAKCVRCPCNGHTDTCDLEFGICGECHHNTYGERCERCKVGFYGNPMQGTPNDCIRCACPLVEDSNNFSPSCQLTRLSFDINQFGDNNENSEYICTQCPNGYTGDHCEMCDDGFYGNPTAVGSKCLPCRCDGGPCDIFTGECIECLGNTDGWRCERCKLGHWGDPLLGCKSCDCYDQGSTSDVCDTNTGQCLCKSQFTGQKCDNCDIGYADIDLKCPPCDCNINGSADVICNPISGQCNCKAGVGGLKCDTCDDEFHGLTEAGCEGMCIFLIS